MKAWPKVALGEVLCAADEPVSVRQESTYPNFGIYGFGRGLFSKPPIDGMTSSARTLYRVRAGNFIYSRLFAFEGAYGLVDDELDLHFVSNEYPSFEIDRERLDPRFLKAYFQLRFVWEAIARGSRGVGSRRIRVHPTQVLAHEMPMPPLSEQQALVRRLDTLADRVRQVNAHLDAIERDADRLLAVRFREAITDAPMRPMAEVAPVIRRSVQLDMTKHYREVGARSFGKGLFFKPDFAGSEATWQKPVWIKAGDLVLSNIKAWEGAIAIAGEEHENCIASHRYITCVPDANMATVGFIAYFLLSAEGLEQVSLASPGTADRNRTLSLNNLEKIHVPVPLLAVQHSFDALRGKINKMKSRYITIRNANNALIPATLERLFAADHG